MADETEFLVVKNRAYSRLAAAITVDAASLTVTAGEGTNFPSTYPFHLTIEDEIVSVTNRTTDAMTIVRARQGTSAAAHANKSHVALNITAKSVTDLNTAVNFIEKYADYGLSFYGVVTTYTDTTHFKVSGLTGLGDDFLKGYYAFVVWDAAGGGAAPQGEQRLVSNYTSTDGTIAHATFSTPVAVGDKVLFIHPLVATLKALIETVDGVVDTIVAKTNNLPSDPADQSLIEAETGAIITIVNNILAKTNNLPSDPADQSLIEAETGAIITAVNNVLAKTNNLPSDPADQSLLVAEIAALVTDYLNHGTHGLPTLETLLDAIIVDLTSAVTQPPVAKSLHDILHKDGSFTYNKKTDSLEAISDELHATHGHIFILFVIPEAVDDITDDNAILLIELQKMSHVHTITQADALDFPAFGLYTLCVMGSNSGTAWTDTGANLADLKTVIGLPLLTVDKIAAAYFKIGTAVTPDPTGKTTIDVISEIAGTLMGIGEDSHYIITGLAAELNTVSSESATYHSLDMSNANITAKVFACADNDPDLTSSNEDVVMGLIPQVLEDGSIGKDEEGVDVAAAMGFLGFCYEGAKLTTLGKAAFKLFAHMMVETKIASPLETPNAAVVDLRKRLLGNMKNSFTNTDPMVEYIVGTDSAGTRLPNGKSLYDLIGNPTGDTKATLTAKWGNITRSLDLMLGSRWDSSGDLGTDINTLVTRITAAVATASGLTTHDTDIKNLLSTIQTDLDNPSQYKATGFATSGALTTHDSALTTAKAVIDAIKTILDTPGDFMANITSLALEATLGSPNDGDISTDIVNVQTVVDALDTLTKAAGDGDLAAMKTAIDLIVAAGPTNAQLNTAIALITTVTDNLPNSGALTDIISTLGAITAAGPTNTQMNTARDAIIAAFPAMVGTDNAATVADGWDSALATILDNFNATRIGDLDELADANLPTDVANVKTDTGNIKTQTDKLAGASPSVGTATEDWNTAEANIVSIGANDTKNKLHSLLLDISGLTAAATITIRMYIQVNGNEKKVYDQDFVVGTDPDGLWIVNGMVGIHEVLRVTAESDDATDDGLTIAYDYMLEVM